MPPQILPFSFGEETVNDGDFATVTCAVIKGDSPVSIIWNFNNSDIGQKEGVFISKSGTRASALTIEAVREENSGAYTCIAKNAGGITNYTAKLHVNGTLHRRRCLLILISFLSVPKFLKNHLKFIFKK